jgi:adenosylhomocysteine nucleosidase
MILVLTPLALEHAALLKALNELDNSSGINSGRSLEVAVGGHGKVQFALTTQLLIQKFKPKLVVCAGAAGSLFSELRVGDVVVSEATIEHDFKLKFVDRPLPVFPGCLSSVDLLRRRAVDFEKFRLHIGRVASGDEDIIDADRAGELRTETDCIAVAWEGAGGARAARLHGVSFVEIRGITDAGNNQAAAEFQKNLPRAMSHVAEVIAELVGAYEVSTSPKGR